MFEKPTTGFGTILNGSGEPAPQKSPCVLGFPRAVIVQSFADFSPTVTLTKKSKHVPSSPWHGMIVEPLNLGFRQAVQMPELGRPRMRWL